MLSSNTYDAEKLAQLRNLARFSMCEVVAIYLPGGVRYFGSAAFDKMPNFSEINRDGDHITVDPRLIGRVVDNVHVSADVSDDRVSLNFIDLDGEISTLLSDAEGTKVELFYYLPELDWFVSHWWGHLQLPDQVDLTGYNASAECGIRSSQMSVPRPTFQRPCQNTFGGALPTQAAIDCGLCPYNRGVGGAIGNLDGGVPFTSCPKSEAACIARLGDKLSYTGVVTTVVAITIGQTHGPATQAVSRGNETNLTRTWRRIYGPRTVRDMDLLAIRQEHNSGHPDQGFLAAIFGGIVGRIRSMSACSIINMMVGAEHLNTRLGAPRQPATAYAPGVSNFNGQGHFFGRVGPLNPGGYNAQNVYGQCTVEGADDVRVYTSEGIYTEEYTTNPAWCFLDLYFKPFFGHGVDLAIMVMQDWIDLALWLTDIVSFTDVEGVVRSGMRGVFNADVQGRTAQAQFDDICLWHRFMPPFQYLGKLRTFPLRPLTEEELADAPVFYDSGAQCNILWSENRPLISWSRISDRNLPNELRVTFEETDASQNISNIERPLTFLDEAAQLRAGQAFGDTTLRAIPQSYQAFGITSLQEVVRKATQMLYTGERDQGGLINNFRVTFTAKFTAGFELYPGQVIRIESDFIAAASAGLQEGGFKFYRVLWKTRQSDLSFEVVLQAYPDLYWANAETVTVIGGGPLPGGYEAEDPGNDLLGTALVDPDEDCSGSFKVVGLGEEGTLVFNNITGGDTITHLVRVMYKAESPLDFRIRSNSNAAQLKHVVATGALPRAVFVFLNLVEGDTNTITIFNPAGGGAAPDIDRIFVEPFEIEPGGGGPCRPGFTSAELVDGRLRIEVPPC
jgi:hypothetical protein